MRARWLTEPRKRKPMFTGILSPEDGYIDFALGGTPVVPQLVDADNAATIRAGIMAFNAANLPVPAVGDADTVAHREAAAKKMRAAVDKAKLAPLAWAYRVLLTMAFVEPLLAGRSLGAAIAGLFGPIGAVVGVAMNTHGVIIGYRAKKAAEPYAVLAQTWEKDFQRQRDAAKKEYDAWLLQSLAVQTSTQEKQRAAIEKAVGAQAQTAATTQKWVIRGLAGAGLLVSVLVFATLGGRRGN